MHFVASRVLEFIAFRGIHSEEREGRVLLGEGRAEEKFGDKKARLAVCGGDADFSGGHFVWIWSGRVEKWNSIVAAGKPCL